MKTFLDWRNPTRSLSSPFQLGANQRPLKIFYDRETFLLGMATTLLDELQSAPYTEIESTWLDGEDCVEIEEHSDDGTIVTLRRRNGARSTFVGNYSTWTRFAQAEYEADKQMPEGPWKSPEHRVRRLLLLDVAQTHRADLFITDDRFLLEVNDLEIQGTNVVSTLDGVAILGAYLRNCRAFVYKSSPDGKFTASLAGNSFYIACRKSVQDLSPILNCQILEPEMKHSVSRAFHAIGPRTEQMLRARDSAVVALLQPHSDHTFDDALFAFDMFMLTLGSAFDSLARMAHSILRLNGKDQHADWRSDGWLTALRAHS